MTRPHLLILFGVLHTHQQEILFGACVRGNYFYTADRTVPLMKITYLAFKWVFMILFEICQCFVLFYIRQTLMNFNDIVLDYVILRNTARETITLYIRYGRLKFLPMESV